MRLPQALQQRIESTLSTQIVNTQAVGGGCISEAVLLETKSRGQFFLKKNETAPAGFFEAEARGLRELQIAGAIRVPEVIATSDAKDNTPKFILLEYLEPGRKTKTLEATLGEQLAALHRVQAKQFGFEEHNFIGSLPQRNTNCGSWAEFFIRERLEVQLELGIERGWSTPELRKLFDAKRESVATLLAQSQEPPALLHGDLWSGNVYWADSGPALIDPAVYYGNREADLAFTELFGGFGAEFYQAYNDSFPLAAGYEQRKAVLNLYHLMTHSNLFGGSYIQSVTTSLREIAV